MKAIKLNTIITSIRSKKDGSLGLTLSTPELSVPEKSVFLELHNINLDMELTPLDHIASEVVSVDKDLETKTQSQRIRSVLYLIWKQEGEEGEFSLYYKHKTEKYLEFLKAKLDGE